ncbi:igA-specific serine endopeptidase autotransporter [Chlorella sorokiniana]|uniref:IgA-specific serine endopeptidase autotransporter n=1 Tax=Chlorella sorokiniana TaxID=3076 RepID=A0A2P6TFB1_CHLSO|nr:igA-specific serine endopeptidase autotransporter [Chlorella sorokiniana]|eukprot:PRW32653.1 igA-specific serine endopeptidase autotransporter [Chlorella sorokiniana]
MGAQPVTSLLLRMLLLGMRCDTALLLALAWRSGFEPAGPLLLIHVATGSLFCLMQTWMTAKPKLLTSGTPCTATRTHTLNSPRRRTPAKVSAPPSSAPSLAHLAAAALAAECAAAKHALRTAESELAAQQRELNLERWLRRTAQGKLAHVQDNWQLEQEWLSSDAAKASLQREDEARQAAEDCLWQETSARLAAETSLRQQTMARQAAELKLRQEAAARQKAECSLREVSTARQAAQHSLRQETAARQAAEQGLQAAEERARNAEAAQQAAEQSLQAAEERECNAEAACVAKQTLVDWERSLARTAEQHEEAQWAAKDAADTAGQEQPPVKQSEPKKPVTCPALSRRYA